MEVAAAKAPRQLLARGGLAAAAPCPAVNSGGGVVVFFAALVAGALVSACWMSASARLQVAPITPAATPTIARNAATGPEPAPGPPRFAGGGTSTNQTPSAAAPANFAPPPRPRELPPAPSPAEAAAPAARECPAYFRWIHEDLRPWRDAGVTLDAVERARRYAAKFRVTVVAGRLYVARYGRCFQTRDVFTQWGILQLLRRYPGGVPDLDLMFDCEDRPVVGAADRYHAQPPPLFRYCGSEATLDIPFPDWSFWGWPELNIKPWEALRREIEEGNAMANWTERAPYAYWKGNPNVGAGRRFLLRCNASGKRDWNARIYAQDWGKELQRGFRESDLSKQCTHRYKIYVEGRGWSVSEKYILACDSVALMVRPRFHDFFSRGLAPLRHYWPVRGRGVAMCRSIKFAVDWGNAHPDKAREIGRNASRFVREDLAMGRVYDYMLHLLAEYARLLRYRPAVPRGAAEVTVESIARGRRGLERQFMMETAVADDGAGGEGPCRLPPPFSAQELQALRRERADVVRQVEAWEDH
ncbi:hypothetical protein PAHAL_7G233500 [Panicum hallii]|uniref:Glycosyl transferase CAP10 domain-containing protein n=1 Tax=Panicum hallii TaxID=206008 RepID=A0A2S3I8Q7_9POAL|nr:O-glucosyltransferase rumi homolog isoform X1 [Panicum hallii]PAN39289.1 hypothetical protein PAHAL_7G233500 [Panicum hallii]